MTQNRSNFADAYRKIYEKLKPSDGAGAYIDDFRKSDAPQFKGKSDEKIQKMAVAAYLDDKDKSKKEDVDIKETQVFVVRFLDPKNKKRFAVPYKDKKSADDKMKQLKRDGVKEIEVTKDVLKRGVKFKEQYELEEAKFAVKLSFLDKPIYIDSESAGKVKMGLRKALKKPEAIISVDRVMPADYKADLRDRIKGKKDDEEGEDKEDKKENVNYEFKQIIEEIEKLKVTDADKKLNTIAYQRMLEGDENYEDATSPSIEDEEKYNIEEATDKQKRLQRAKDMIKYYDAQKKAALKGKNKKLAKKMLKNMYAKYDEPEFSKKNFAFNKIGLVAKDLKKKELGQVTDEGRKSKYDMDQDDEEGANRNIIMQLRKSVDLKGLFNVEFEDGKKVKVKDTIARAAVLKHAGMKRPAEKLAFQKKIEKSYRDLLNAIKGR